MIEWMRKPLSGGRYFLWGIYLFAMKVMADRLIAEKAFQKSREGILNYLEGYSFFGDTFHSLSILMSSSEGRSFHLALLTLALPFMGIGLILTYRRLATMGLHPWIAILFFIPYVQLLFFILLSALPSGANKSGLKGDWLGRFLPDSKWGAAAAAVGLSGIFGLSMVFLSVNFMRLYGGYLFVGLPFCLGFLSVLLYRPLHRVGPGEAMAVALCSLCAVSVLLLAFALEGVFCILMAFPLAVLLGFLGTLFALGIRHTLSDPWRPAAMVMLGLPLLTGFEKAAQMEPTLFPVVSFVHIAAPPDTVWKNVVTFSRLPEPDEWVFRIGIAYPTHAEIEGQGVGAVRRCHFSTGPFVEPITVWDAPKKLAFSVVEQPQPMFEMSPYDHVHAPHLDSFLVSKRGQFLLTPLPDGGTLLEGTTWYQHTMWPEAYWKLWSDFLIHKIHLRVLNHIKSLSEQGNPHP